MNSREGPPEPEDVVIVPYDPAWPLRVVEVARELRRALDGAVERIDHVGSTAVPGLPAKDVIDVQISVASFEPADAYHEPLRGNGRPRAHGARRLLDLGRAARRAGCVRSFA